MTQTEYSNPRSSISFGAGQGTFFYAEGDRNHHLKAFAELPDRSIVYHGDMADIFEAHDVFGEKFCLSGGIPNVLLAFRSPEEVRQCIKEVIERVAPNGGYIMDAAAIIQNDAKVENVRAMTEATLEYGVYSQGHSTAAGAPKPDPADATPGAFITPATNGRVPPGACIPWSQKRPDMPDIQGDEQLCETVWNNIDALGNVFIWQCLLSF